MNTLADAMKKAGVAVKEFEEVYDLKDVKFPLINRHYQGDKFMTNPLSLVEYANKIHKAAKKISQADLYGMFLSKPQNADVLKVLKKHKGKLYRLPDNDVIISESGVLGTHSNRMVRSENIEKQFEYGDDVQMFSYYFVYNVPNKMWTVKIFDWAMAENKFKKCTCCFDVDARRHNLNVMADNGLFDKSDRIYVKVTEDTDMYWSHPAYINRGMKFDTLTVPYIGQMFLVNESVLNGELAEWRKNGGYIQPNTYYLYKRKNEKNFFLQPYKPWMEANK